MRVWRVDDRNGSGSGSSSTNTTTHHIKDIVGAGHDDVVTAVHISPYHISDTSNSNTTASNINSRNNSCIVTCGRQGSLCVWNCHTGVCVGVLEGYCSVSKAK